MSEKIYYDMRTDKAYRGDGSDIANDNVPELRYKDDRYFEVQLLATDHKDGNGAFDDPYTDLDGVAAAASAAIDNNKTHYFDGLIHTAITGGAAIATVKVKSLSGTPRSCGTIRLVNSTGQTETVNYNGFSVALAVYTFTLADSDFVVGSQTPTYSHAENDKTRVLELPIVKDAACDISQIADGILTIHADCNKLIYQELVHGSEEISGTLMEWQIFDSGTKRVLVKSIPVKLLSVLDDDGAVGPAPQGDYYNKTASDGRYVQAALGTAYAKESSPSATDKLAILTAGGLRHVEVGDLPAGSPADDSITTAKILNANVTAAKLASDAVETAKIKDANVTAAKLATDAVETAKIKDLNVTEGKLAAEAVTTAKLATGERMNKTNIEAALTGEISSHTHAATAPATDSVDTEHVKDGAITSEKLDVNLAESLVTKARIEAVLTGAIATHTHNLSDIEIENGIDTPKAALDETDNGKWITAQVSTDTPPAGASLLLHLNGNATDYGAAGLAVTNTGVTFEASEGPQWGSQRAVFDGTAKLSVADSDGFAPGTNGAFLALARVTFATGTLAQVHTILSKESPASKGFRLEWNPTRGLVFSWADAAGAVFTGEMSVYWLPVVETGYTVGVAYSGTALTLFVTTGGTYTVAMATETRAVTIYNESNALLVGESGETGEENNFEGTLDELLFWKGDPATFVTISGTGVTNTAPYAPLDGDVLVTRKYDITDQTEDQYVYYVDKTAGSDLNTGATEATAIQNLTEAIARIGGRSGRFTIYLKYGSTHTLTNYLTLGKNSDNINTASASYTFQSYGGPGAVPVIATEAYHISLMGPVSAYFYGVVLTSTSGQIFSSAVGESAITLISCTLYGDRPDTSPIFSVYQAAKMLVLAKSTMFTVVGGFGTPATDQPLYELTDESCGFEFYGESNTYSGTPAYYLTPPNIAGKEGVDVDGVTLKDGGIKFGSNAGPTNENGEYVGALINYYVSTAGSDTAAGTAAAPLATIEEAIARIVRLNAKYAGILLERDQTHAVAADIEVNNIGLLFNVNGSGANPIINLAGNRIILRAGGSCTFTAISVNANTGGAGNANGMLATNYGHGTFSFSSCTIIGDDSTPRVIFRPSGQSSMLVMMNSTTVRGNGSGAGRAVYAVATAGRFEINDVSGTWSSGDYTLPAENTPLV
jgi:hypothetical protein